MRIISLLKKPGIDERGLVGVSLARRGGVLGSSETARAPPDVASCVADRVSHASVGALNSPTPVTHLALQPLLLTAVRGYI